MIHMDYSRPKPQKVSSEVKNEISEYIKTLDNDILENIKKIKFKDFSTDDYNCFYVFDNSLSFLYQKVYHNIKTQYSTPAIHNAIYDIMKKEFKSKYNVIIENKLIELLNKDNNNIIVYLKDVEEKDIPKNILESIEWYMTGNDLDLF